MNRVKQNMVFTRFDPQHIASVPYLTLSPVTQANSATPDTRKFAQLRPLAQGAPSGFPRRAEAVAAKP